MKNRFEIAAASIKGRSHKIDGKNNQDAFFFIQDADLIVALVADGCGSGKNSEVGAALAVRMMAQLIRKNISSEHAGFEQVLEKARLDFLAQLRLMANGMGEDFPQTIVDYFLFTLVGAVVTAEECAMFSIGDGVIVLNGEVSDLGPFPGNCPPYMSYGIVGSSLGKSNPELLKFQINRKVSTEDVASLIIGTDGVNDLIAVKDKNLPGKAETVGDISYFWKNDSYFRNKDKLRRRLSLMNADAVKYERSKQGFITDVKKENGLLPDDTTMIVIRKKPVEGG